MSGYESPTIQAWGEQRKARELEAERRSQPRQDWTDLTYEEFTALSGTERNQLYRADQDQYRAMQDQTNNQQEG